MASIASHGGIGLPFNCDIFAQFNGISKRKFLGCPIVISNGGHRRWRIEAVGKKKRSKRSKAKEKSTEEKPKRLVPRHDELSCFRGLILDFSYRPVNVVCWKRAFCLEFTEKADVLEYYDQTVSSPRRPYNIPAVLRIPQLLPVERKVSACFKCNSKKAQQTLEEANMTLLSTPKAPEVIDIVAMPQKQQIIKMLLKKGVPDKWAQYVGKPKSTIDDLNLKELSIDDAS